MSTDPDQSTLSRCQSPRDRTRLDVTDVCHRERLERLGDLGMSGQQFRQQIGPFPGAQSVEGRR